MLTDASTRERLLAAARAASERAYCPYSGSRVGAAVLTASGSIHAGCNVENVSYGLTVCAERNAIYQAIAAGERDLLAVAVCGPGAHATPPCGACRQVILEFAPGAEIAATCAGGETRSWRLAELLPSPFEGRHIEKADPPAARSSPGRPRT